MLSNSLGVKCSHVLVLAAAAAALLQSCPTLCDPIDGRPPGFPSLGPRGHPALGEEERKQLVLPGPSCAQWLLGKSLGDGVAAGGLWNGSPAPTPAGRKPKPTSHPGRGADIDHLRARG